MPGLGEISHGFRVCLLATRIFRILGLVRFGIGFVSHPQRIGRTAPHVGRGLGYIPSSPFFRRFFRLAYLIRHVSVGVRALGFPIAFVCSLPPARLPSELGCVCGLSLPSRLAVALVGNPPHPLAPPVVGASANGVTTGFDRHVVSSRLFVRGPHMKLSAPALAERSAVRWGLPRLSSATLVGSATASRAGRLGYASA